MLPPQLLMQGTPWLETNLPSLSNAGALHGCGLFAGASLAWRLEKSSQLHCGRASCYDVKFRNDWVEADVQVSFEGLMICIAGSCHGIQALWQPCALIAVDVLGQYFC